MGGGGGGRGGGGRREKGWGGEGKKLTSWFLPLPPKPPLDFFFFCIGMLNFTSQRNVVFN